MMEITTTERPLYQPVEYHEENICIMETPDIREIEAIDSGKFNKCRVPTRYLNNLWILWTSCFILSHGFNSMGDLAPTWPTGTKELTN